MVGDEPDRCHQDRTVTLGRELLHRFDQVRPEPGLPGVTLALVGEAPLLDARPPGDQLRGAQQLFLVGIALIEDARRQAVRGEDRHHLLGIRELGADHPHVVGDRLEIAVELVPALDEVQAGRRRAVPSRREGLVHLASVAAGADRREVGRQHDRDHVVRATIDDLVDRRRDARRTMLHPEVDRVHPVVRRIDV